MDASLWLRMLVHCISPQHLSSSSPVPMLLDGLHPRQEGCWCSCPSTPLLVATVFHDSQAQSVLVLSRRPSLAHNPGLFGGGILRVHPSEGLAYGCHPCMHSLLPSSTAQAHVMGVRGVNCSRLHQGCNLRNHKVHFFSFFWLTDYGIGARV